MSFIKPQIVQDHYFEVSTSEGSFWLPTYALGENPDAKTFQDLYELEYLGHELIYGWGARMSAPGYMDCTDWCVFDTEAEAKEYLRETYDAQIDEVDEVEKEPHCESCRDDWSFHMRRCPVDGCGGVVDDHCEPPHCCKCLTKLPDGPDGPMARPAPDGSALQIDVEKKEES